MVVKAADFAAGAAQGFVVSNAVALGVWQAYQVTILPPWLPDLHLL